MLGFVPATRFEQSPDLEMRFPPLPRTVAEVTRLLSEPGMVPDTDKLIEIVEMDPVIVSSVLRRINSAYYGLRKLIGELRKAVFLLGFLEVSNIVLTEGMLKLRTVVHSDEQSEIFRRIMETSIGAATLGQNLALFLRLSGKGIAFTGGLLHSVGRLVLLYNKPNDYEALWWTNDSGSAPSAEAEQLIFGTDHARLGGMAADKWHLPEDLAAIIEGYVAPAMVKDPSTQILALITNVAVSCSEQILKTKQGATVKLDPPNAINLLAQKTGKTVAELTEYLESIVDDTRQFVNEAMMHL